MQLEWERDSFPRTWPMIFKIKILMEVLKRVIHCWKCNCQMENPVEDCLQYRGKKNRVEV